MGVKWVVLMVALKAPMSVVQMVERRAMATVDLMVYLKVGRLAGYLAG
jgi:hypothetical protein